MIFPFLGGISLTSSAVDTIFCSVQKRDPAYYLSCNVNSLKAVTVDRKTFGIKLNAFSNHTFLSSRLTQNTGRELFKYETQEKKSEHSESLFMS